MIHPNIRGFREDIRGHYIAPIKDRLRFLGKNALDVRWHKNEPRVNLRKKDNLFEMEISLPGFEKENIDISIDNDLLKIVAEKEEEKDAADYILKEFDHDKVERVFKLANGIGREKVTAEYRNGVLKIVFIDVPPKEEKDRKRVVIG